MAVPAATVAIEGMAYRTGMLVVAGTVVMAALEVEVQQQIPAALVLDSSLIPQQLPQTSLLTASPFKR